MIDAVYIFCSKKDFYFARISIASIRYWNVAVPIRLVKDLSHGQFDTNLMAQCMGVEVMKTPFPNLGYYAKLYPFLEQQQNERIIIQDADSIWCSDLAAVFSRYGADIVFDGYQPESRGETVNDWYFNFKKLKKAFPHYQYPGFVFNVGQMLVNTNAFSKTDFEPLLKWENEPKPKQDDIFFYEQGMLNYLVAEKIRTNQATVAQQQLHIWGWDNCVHEISKTFKDGPTQYPYLVHWYGKKYGLISILPGAGLLKFYEQWYFKKCGLHKYNLHFTQLARTAKSPFRYVYHMLKQLIK